MFWEIFSGNIQLGSIATLDRMETDAEELIFWNTCSDFFQESGFKFSEIKTHYEKQSQKTFEK